MVGIRSRPPATPCRRMETPVLQVRRRAAWADCPEPNRQQGLRQMPGTDANGPTLDDAGGEAAGSNVISFPGCLRPVAGSSALGVEDGAARLDRALLALTQALAEQREAVRAWRQDLGNLAGSMNSLADGLCALNAELEAASGKLKAGADEQHGCNQGDRA